MPSASIDLKALDGYRLAGDLFAPATDGATRGAVLIASATGVPRQIYRHFAEDLAARGFATVTFDYRGIGGSAPTTLKGFDASMHTWGEQDVSGALKELAQRFGGAPLFYVGHSVGGQLLGIASGTHLLRAAAFVAAQSGYWKHWSGVRRLWMLANWYAAIPVLSHAFGYMPMKRVASGEDLPKNVALEWARWGRRPEYILSHRSTGFATFARPIRAFALTDDHYAPVPAVKELLRFYANAPSELRVVSPKDVGRNVGHFGFFKPHFRDALWSDVHAFFERHVPPAEQADARAARPAALRVHG